MKKILIVLCCAMLLAFGLFEIRFVETAEENQSREREFAQETGDESRKTIAPATENIVFTFKDEGGKGCEGVKLFIHKVWTDAGQKNVTLTSNKDGQIVFDRKEIESPDGSFRAYTFLPGHATLQLRFHPKYGTWPIPESFEVTMERGREIGGQIVDENGQPIANASVILEYPLSIYPDRQNPIYNSSLSNYSERVWKTDTEGKWSCDLFPQGFYYGEIRVSASDYTESRQLIRPEIVPDEFKTFLEKALNFYGDRTVPLSELLAQTLVIPLKKGLVVRGKVVGSEGTPVENLRITVSNYNIQPYFFSGVTSDQEGNFECLIPKPMEVNFGIWGKKAAPERFVRNIGETNEPFEFQLKASKSIRFRVVDNDGKPLQNVMVIVHTGKEGLWLGNCLNNSDTEGRIEWDSAPEETIHYTFSLAGYQKLEEIPLEPREEEHVVVMRRTDAQPPVVVTETPNVEQTETQRYVDKMIRQTTCETRMKQIVTALFGYHQKYDCFPEAFTTDKDGKPLQSWRVAILPFLGEKELYEKIRKEEPWNSEYNRQFHARCPRLFQCPDAIIVHPEMAAKGLTTYALIVGETAYPEGGRFSLDREHFLDGTANTWAITERAAPACWMDPKGNIPQKEAEKGIGGSPSGIGIYHDGFALYHESTHEQQGVHACFFSGDVKFFARNLAKDVIKAVITPRGGEVFFIYQYDDP